MVESINCTGVFISTSILRRFLDDLDCVFNGNYPDSTLESIKDVVSELRFKMRDL